MPNGFAKLGRKFYFGPYKSAVIPNAAFLVGPSCRFRCLASLACSRALFFSSNTRASFSTASRFLHAASGLQAVLIARVGYRFVALDRVQRPLALELS